MQSNTYLLYLLLFANYLFALCTFLIYTVSAAIRNTPKATL